MLVFKFECWEKDRTASPQELAALTNKSIERAAELNRRKYRLFDGQS